MIKTIAASAVLFACGISMATAQTATPPAPKMEMTQAQCQAMWTKMDATKAGNLTEAQTSGSITDFKAADSNGDGKLSSAEFLAACQRGIVRDTATTGAGSGSNDSNKTGSGSMAK